MPQLQSIVPITCNILWKGMLPLSYQNITINEMRTNDWNKRNVYRIENKHHRWAVHENKYHECRAKNKYYRIHNYKCGMYKQRYMMDELCRKFAVSISNIRACLPDFRRHAKDRKTRKDRTCGQRDEGRFLLQQIENLFPRRKFARVTSLSRLLTVRNLRDGRCRSAVRGGGGHLITSRRRRRDWKSGQLV